MIFKEWMDAVGVSALLIAIVVPLWKADDAISADARRDISNYLTNFDYQYPANLMRETIISVLEFIYGRNLLSVKSFFVSISLSLFVFIAFFTSFIFFTASTIISFEDKFSNTKIYLPKITSSEIYIIISFIFISMLFGFLSIIKTRFLFFLNRWYVIIIFLIDVVSTFIFYIIISNLIAGILISNNLAFDFESFNLYVNWIYYVINDYFSSDLSHNNPKIHFIWGAIFSSMFVVVICSIWSLFLITGSLLIRILNKTQIMFWFLYILPIDEKPIRSIGIFSSILIISFFLIVRATYSVFG